MGTENDAKTEIELEFAGGDYLFKLPLTMLKELQRECGATMGQIMARIFKGRYLFSGEPMGQVEEAAFAAEDLHWIPRMALTGGNRGVVADETRTVNANDADRLCKAHYDDLPVHEKWTLCAALMGALYQGYRPAAAASPPKKKAPRAARPTTDISTSRAH